MLQPFERSACLTNKIQEMEQNLAFALIFISIITACTIVIIALLNYRLKNRLIRSGLANEDTVRILNGLNNANRTDMLKWGIIIFFSSLGLLVLHVVPYRENSLLPYGIEGIFLSIGLFTSYLVSRKN